MSSGLPFERPATFTIPAGKLSRYLLNPAHPKGAPKAAWFSKHGCKRESPAQLEAALLRHAKTQLIIEQTPTPWGIQFVVKCEIALPDGMKRCIRSVWQQPHGGGAAALITAFCEGA
jgi:hypothetical protein